MNSFRYLSCSMPAHREQQTGDHESERDGIVPRAQMCHPVEGRRRLASDGGQLKHHQPDEADQHQADKQTNEPHTGRSDLHLHGRAADGADREIVLLADLGLGHDYLGISRGYLNTLNRTGATITIAAAPMAWLRDYSNPAGGRETESGCGTHAV